MNKILDKLTALIENYNSYIVDGSLNRNLLAADARKYDPELLNLLQKDKEIKEHFFATTDGGLVFKKDVFLQFIMNKEFLPDSYTKYKIKIGLGAEDGSLLSESGDVVLNWPYKDAILEGGQDKEDQKRSEVFFNEVLAPDQITRLLDDKVFTNWKRYDKDGEHDLDELKDDDNLIIKGNNLVVLRSLTNRFKNKIKFIYIDPPYNTGSDSFGYNDKFNHSSWLTFMKNRLEAAKALLSNDGTIAIHCDDNELAHLKILAEEVFGKSPHGKNNFVQYIEVKANVGAANEYQNPFMPKNCEYILLFAKNYDARNYKPLWVKSSIDKSYSKFIKNFNDTSDYHTWDVVSVRDAFCEKYSKEEWSDENKVYEFVLKNAYRIFQGIGPKGPGSALKNAMEQSKSSDSGWASYANTKGETVYCHKGRLVRFYSANIKIDENGEEAITRELGSLWTDILWNGIASEGDVTLKAGKKPEKLLRRLIEMSTEPNEIVMDYHLGSGTTAAVAHKMGRQYIGIEQLFYGDNDPTIRLQNVINGDQSGISKGLNWQGGGSFVYANIMNNSNKFRKRVESAKNDSDYLDLLKEATSSSFLSYRVDPKKLNEEEFRKLSAADKRRLLLELIDNNTLYVNYEDINDPLFKVSEADKKFNAVFYNTTNDDSKAK